MLRSTLRIAWRNLGRNPRRTALALAAIAIAQLAVLAMDGLMNGWVETTQETLTGPMMGHVQIHARDWREERAPDLVIDNLGETLANVRAAEGVEQAYARIYAPALAARDVDGHAVMIVGIDIAAESEQGGLLQGLPAEARPSGYSVLVGSILARDTGIEVGDEIAVLGTAADGSMANDLVTVVGVLSTPMDLVNRMGIVMPIATAQEIFAMPDQAHEINVRGIGIEQSEALAATLAGVEGVSDHEVLTWRELAPELSQFLDIADIYGLIVLFIVFIAAATGIANTLLMATFERRRELGMLLSLGTTPGRLVRIVMTEAVLLGLMGVVIGSVLGTLLVLYQGHVGIDPTAMAGQEESTDMAMYGINFSAPIYPYLRVKDYVPGFVGIVVVSVFAAVWPAVVTARLEPMEAMRG